jgi:hypothetical protein
LGLGAAEILDNFDSPASETADPVGGLSTFIEPDGAGVFASCAAEDAADAGPRDRAQAHRAGFGACNQFADRVVCAEIVGTDGLLGQGNGDHLGVSDRAVRRHHDGDARRDKPPAVCIEDRCAKRSACLPFDILLG